MVHAAPSRSKDNETWDDMKESATGYHRSTTILQELVEEAKALSPQYKGPENNEGICIAELPSSQLAADAYGVGIMCMVQGFDNLSCAESHVKRFEGLFLIAYGVGVLSLNGCMQLFLIIYTRKYVLHGLAKDMRALYNRYHEEVFIDGAFQQDKWNEWDTDDKEMLCQFPLSVPMFFFTILLLWSLVIGGELRSCLRLLYDISLLPIADHREGLVMSNNGQHIITHMRCTPRWCIYVFVALPKLAIALITWWYGCRWLCSTPLFADLILNSCALGFIVTIDEILYAAVTPESVRLQLERTSIYAERLQSQIVDRAWKDIYLLSYLSSVAYFAFGVLATYLYIFKFERVLPNYQWDVTEHCERAI